MSNLFLIFSIYSIAYILRNLAGPFNLFDKLRIFLFNNKLFGVFFFELFSCPWCFGFHCGYIVYLLFTNNILIKEILLWGLVGSFITFVFDQLFDLIFIFKEKLNKS